MTKLNIQIHQDLNLCVLNVKYLVTWKLSPRLASCKPLLIKHHNRSTTTGYNLSLFSGQLGNTRREKWLVFKSFLVNVRLFIFKNMLLRVCMCCTTETNAKRIAESLSCCEKMWSSIVGTEYHLIMFFSHFLTIFGTILC